jgi:hypothetical protein
MPARTGTATLPLHGARAPALNSARVDRSERVKAFRRLASFAGEPAG